MGTGETVLVTAAAGGTGQFAVQLAKLAGNTVVATCGGPEKAALLRSLGVDRVIDYRKEDVGQVRHWGRECFGQPLILVMIVKYVGGLCKREGGAKVFGFSEG